MLASACSTARSSGALHASAAVGCTGRPEPSCAPALPSHLLLAAAPPAAKPSLVLRPIPAQVSFQGLLSAARRPCCSCAAAAAKVARRAARRAALCALRCRALRCCALRCLASGDWRWVGDHWDGHEGREEAAAIGVPAEEVCRVGWDGRRSYSFGESSRQQQLLLQQERQQQPWQHAPQAIKNASGQYCHHCPARQHPRAARAP